MRRIKGPAKKGFHRVNWDLRFPQLSSVKKGDNSEEEPTGFLVAPGTYTVSLSQRVRGETIELVEPQSFEVKRLRDGALRPQADTAEFWNKVSEFDRSVTALSETITILESKVELLALATERVTNGDPASLDNRLQSIQDDVNSASELLNGNVARNAIFERTQPTVRSRLGFVLTGVARSTYGPTQSHRDQLAIAKSEFGAIQQSVSQLRNSVIPEFEAELIASGAPWVPGGKIP